MGGVGAGQRFALFVYTPQKGGPSRCRGWRIIASEMIAFLRRQAARETSNQVIVEAGGVGYDVVIRFRLFPRFPTRARRSGAAHSHARSGGCARAVRLPDFGRESAVRKTDLGLSGIGPPRLAIKVLSGLATPAIIDSIRGGHVEQLVRIPGVGKKRRNEWFLELKDKMEDWERCGAAGSFRAG